MVTADLMLLMSGRTTWQPLTQLADTEQKPSVKACGVLPAVHNLDSYVSNLTP